MEYTMSPVAQTEMPVANTISYAGFWKRFLAWLLDWLIVTACFTVVLFIFRIGIWDGRMRYEGPAAWAALGGLSLFVLLEVTGTWLYFALMESSPNQGTLGKMALGLRVTDMDGKRISFGRATGRYFAKFISTITLMIGFIMAAFTPKKQAMHDMIASTFVLSKQATVPAQVGQNAYAAQS